MKKALTLVVKSPLEFISISWGVLQSPVFVPGPHMLACARAPHAGLCHTNVIKPPLIVTRAPAHVTFLRG